MEELFARQDGVVARRQLLALGLSSHEIRRMFRRRDLVRLQTGVYLNHTGRPSWQQVAWAGVLHHWPAALSHESALRAAGLRVREQEGVHVAVDRNRGLVAGPGVTLHRVSGLDGRVAWQGRPPRVRIEEAVVDVASGARAESDAIALLADAVQARTVTAARLIAAIEGRKRTARRELMTAVLRDVQDGTGSVLEHGYLTRVERPHGLPVGLRQVRAGAVYRDVLYPDFSQVVELDGRTFHDGAARRDADLGRDLRAAVEGLNTVRIGWGQVFARPCVTAEQVGALLRARGWTGRPRRCPDCV